MAEGYLVIRDVPNGLATAEADLKTKYTWTSVTEKHFIKFGQNILVYAQGS